MNTGRYKSMVKADAPITQPGYFKAYLTPIDDFTTLQEPVVGATPALGDAYTIGTSHVWAASKGAIEVLVDAKTLEVTGDTVGAQGALMLNYAPKIFVPGDGPKVLETINNFLNERMILIVQDGCDNKQLIQYGCDCYPVEVNKATFASGTIKGTNAKGYEMTLDAMCKYFYNGTITNRPN